MLNESMYGRFSYFFKKYSLRHYYNANAPAVFFSLWGYGALKNHKSFALIVWRGTDIVKMESRLKSIKKRKNTYHVAISSYISDDLKKYGIKHKFIPVVGVDNKYFKPTPMGNEIYAYVPNSSKKYYDRYGKKLIDKISKKCKYKINVVASDQYKRKKIAEIYEKCFCGLRFTEHDGLPSQVVEMGLMGRRNFYNGNIPGSIRWENNVDHMIEKIEEEAKKINTIDYDYARTVSDFINVGSKWLNTEFWER